jgi:hypothetical protein
MGFSLKHWCFGDEVAHAQRPTFSWSHGLESLNHCVYDYTSTMLSPICKVLSQVSLLLIIKLIDAASFLCCHNQLCMLQLMVLSQWHFLSIVICNNYSNGNFKFESWMLRL